MKEIDVQAKMAKKLRQAGAYAFKIDSRYLTGIMDLFAHHNRIGTFLCEVKFDQTRNVQLPKQGDTFRLALTPKQRLTAKRLKETGALYCWCLVIRFPRGYIYMAGKNPSTTHAVYGVNATLVQLHGEKGVPDKLVELFREAIHDHQD